jgi:anti-anti-sigma factor
MLRNLRLASTPRPNEIVMELKVIQTDDTYTHIALVGKMDVGGVGEIENKFLGFTAARKKGAIVDMSGVTFLGSMGLRIFLDAAKSLTREKKKLILLNPQPMVNEVLEASGISDILMIEHDAAAAVSQAQA